MLIDHQMIFHVFTSLFRSNIPVFCIVTRIRYNLLKCYGSQQDQLPLNLILLVLHCRTGIANPTELFLVFQDSL